jgi:hypothetical protein
MKYIYIFSIILMSTSVSAQGYLDAANLNTASVHNQQFFAASRPVAERFPNLLSGSPYFTDEWMPATIYLGDNTVAKNIQARIDLVEGVLQYKNESGVEMDCIVPVKHVEMVDLKNNKMFTFFPLKMPNVNSGKTSWYQNIYPAATKVKVIKAFEKTIYRKKPLGKSVEEIDINTTKNYYLIQDGNLVKVKGFGDVIKRIDKKNEDAKAYLKANDLEFKKDEDLETFLKYYESIL